MNNFYAGQTDYIDKLNQLATTAELAAYAAIVGSGNGKFPIGSAAAPSVSFASDTDTGIYNISDNVIGVSVGGTQKVQVAASGTTIDALAVTGALTFGSLGTAVPSSALTSVPAASLTGSVPSATLTSVPAGSLTGSVPSATLTSVPAANLTGSVPSATLTSVPAASLTGSVPSATLTSVPAANLTGTWPTVLGNNLNLTGTSSRVSGDFSNATVSSRALVQTSTANSATSLGVAPNGTSNTTDVTTYSSNNGLNASTVSIGVSASSADIKSDITGSGSYKDLSFSTGGSVKATLSTSGLLGLGVVPVSDLDIGKNASVTVAAKSASATPTVYPTYAIYRARGTVASPTAVLAGDTLGNINFSGYGTSYQNSANITTTAVDNFSGTLGGTSLAINTVSQGGIASTEKLKIGATGNINLQASGADLSNLVSINGSQLAGFRNLIINGAMVIDQRNQGAAITPTTLAYSVDRFRLNVSQSSKLTIQQVTDAPAGFYYSVKLTTASAFTSATSDYFSFEQSIEVYNTNDLQFGSAGALPITISFWVKASVPGVYNGSIANGLGNRSYVYSYTATTSWSKVFVTIPGDVTGGWTPTSSQTGVIVRWDMGSGSYYYNSAGSWVATNALKISSSVNLVANASATFNITGVQVERGSVPTAFEHLPLHTYFSSCQRYFTRGTFRNNATSGQVYIGGMIPFRVSMRTAPNVTDFADLVGNYRTVSTNTGNNIGISSGNLTASTQELTMDALLNSNIGNWWACTYKADAEL